MMKIRHYYSSLIFAGISSVLMLNSAQAEFEFRGYIAGEYRSFIHEPADNAQASNGISLAVQPEIHYVFANAQYSMNFSPFARVADDDEERNHADIRSLMVQYVGDDWELRAGIHKVFWGVTESQHLVDIVNQTDLVEDPMGEVKLGQPMFNITLPSRWGVTDIFVLPYFRERTFPGEEGRLRSMPYVDTRQASYESKDKQDNIDYALRWSNSVELWDLGFSYFHGTSREPAFQPLTTPQGVVLAPHYYQMTQWGLDLQATVDAWLLKLEAVNRDLATERYNASALGFEYSIFGIAGSQHDLGLIIEYLYDSRADQADSPFEDDAMFGFRWLANDVAGTEALFGVIVDLDDHERVVNVEASRRLTDHWKLSLLARFYSNLTSEGSLYSLREDDYWQLETSYYF